MDKLDQGKEARIRKRMKYAGMTRYEAEFAEEVESGSLPKGDRIEVSEEEAARMREEDA